MMDPNLGRSGLFDEETPHGIQPLPADIDKNKIVLTTIQKGDTYEWDGRHDISIGENAAA